MKDKKSEFSVFALFTLLFGSVLFVGATILNESVNNTEIILNITNLTSDQVNKNVIVDFNDTNYNSSPIVNETINENITQPDALNESPLIENPVITPPANVPIGMPPLNETINLTQTEQPLTLNETLNLSLNVTENLTVMPTNVSNKSFLAKVYNQDILDFDRELQLKYLEKNNNFTNLEFRKIEGNANYHLKVGPKPDKIRGISIDSKNYVIDLLYCEMSGRYCTFRINGVPAKQLSTFEDSKGKKSTFDINENYSLKVNSIEFGYCGNKRFCHIGYEGYDLVGVSIEMKGVE